MSRYGASVLTMDLLSKWEKDEKWRSNQSIFILTEALDSDLVGQLKQGLGENSLVSFLISDGLMQSGQDLPHFLRTLVLAAAKAVQG